MSLKEEEAGSLVQYITNLAYVQPFEALFPSTYLVSLDIFQLRIPNGGYIYDIYLEFFVFGTLKIHCILSILNEHTIRNKKGWIAFDNYSTLSCLCSGSNRHFPTTAGEFLMFVSVEWLRPQYTVIQMG